MDPEQQRVNFNFCSMQETKTAVAAMLAVPCEDTIGNTD